LVLEIKSVTSVVVTRLGQNDVGEGVVGEFVGSNVGFVLGLVEGATEGDDDGKTEGEDEGEDEGERVGVNEGDEDGDDEGTTDGRDDGARVGDCDGAVVGGGNVGRTLGAEVGTFRLVANLAIQIEQEGRAVWTPIVRVKMSSPVVWSVSSSTH
jgi:hypothetical protein